LIAAARRCDFSTCWSGSILQKDEARYLHPLPEDQIAKILVFRQQYSVFFVCECNDLSVCCAWRVFNDVDDVVAGFTQEPNQGRFNTFVCKPPQSVSQP
jgi:hypothetical protein